MSAAENPADQPISIDSLHEEILWFIFSLNANVRDESPLQTARNTSQVSGLWRKLMLTAPTIWGKGLKLSELHVEKEISPWRDLVMERTGSAPLSIKGELPIARVEWFLGFISPLWGRMCEIDVQPIGRSTRRGFYQEQANFMNTPPLGIVAFNFPEVRFDLQALWLADLRYLGLSKPFSVTEILACLANLPRLEEAKFEQWTPEFATRPLHLNPRIRPVRSGKVSVPNLIKLRVDHMLSEVTDLLAHIIPNAECSYNIRTMEDPFSNETQWDVLFEYIGRHINLSNQTTVNLDIRPRSIIFTVIGDPTTPAFLYTHTMELLQNPEYAVAIYLSRFFMGRAPVSGTLWSKKVNEVAVHVDDGCRGLHQHPDSFTNFFLAFNKSISTLELSRNSILLVQRAFRNNLLAPSVETLKVNAKDTQREPALETLVAGFLDGRRFCGHAIKKLWFYPNVIDLKVDWGFLEEFPDMKVCFTWVREDGTHGEREYLCGSGNPEKLDTRNGLEG